jgi:tetratricopeptide (TPR) repeat protein
MRSPKSALIIVCVALTIGCAAKTKPTNVNRIEEAMEHHSRGVSLSREGQHKEAVTAFRKAARTYPGYGKAYYNMGIAYHELGRDEDAIEAYQKAIEINPADAASHVNLGNIFMRQNHLVAAIRELETAVRIAPAYGNAHYNLAVVYYFGRMYNRAWDHLQKSESLGVVPDPELREAVVRALNPLEGVTEEVD